MKKGTPRSCPRFAKGFSWSNHFNTSTATNSNDKHWLFAQLDDCEALLKRASVAYERTSAEEIAFELDAMKFTIRIEEDPHNIISLATSMPCDALPYTRAQMLDAIEDANSRMRAAKAFLDEQNRLTACTETFVNPAHNYSRQLPPYIVSIMIIIRHILSELKSNNTPTSE